MKTSKPIWSGLLAVTVATLTACGGGGGGGSSSTTSSPSANSGSTQSTVFSKMTGVNGFAVNYAPSSSNATGWTAQVTSPVTYTRITGIDSFVLVDSTSPTNTYAQSGDTGIRAGRFASIGGTQLGGTTYTYSRFGWLSGSVTETNGSTTTSYSPFAFASTTPTAPTNLNYAGTQQALVYLEGDRNTNLSGISGFATCDTSASYTASSKTLQLTLSNCTTGVSFNISGGLTLANGTGTTTLTAQQPQTNLQTMASATVDSGNFLLAGPNGEELVGAATIKGTIALSNGTGSSNPALFFVVFGGKKQ